MDDVTRDFDDSSSESSQSEESSISRAVFEGVGPGGIDLRLYKRGERQLPSVTTVLKTRNDDKSNLYDWQDRNDGEGNAANHEHLFWYSQHVGTLGHWFALRQLDESLEWSDDESQSDREIRQQTELPDSHSPREVLYSALRGDKNKYGGTVSTWGEFYDKHPPYKNGSYYQNALYERAMADIRFFRDAQARLWSKLGLTKESTIAVEKFLYNEDDGYAGQVDLVYLDEYDNVVVADLKSSSGCYDKHQMQGAAYAHAVEQEMDLEVDRLEVHRAHPRTGQMVVHTHSDAPGKQEIHSTKYWNDSYETLWQQFESLLTNFEGETYEF